MTIMDKIAAERQRQFGLPGTEGDFLKSPNDWVATILSILGEGVERSGIPSNRHDFERAVIKAAAVCIAAYDHIDHMIEQKKLAKD